MKRHLVYLVVLGCAVLAACWPLFHAGLYTAHDIWHQVARLHYYTESIKDGQFPPTWVSQLALGRGYPLFYFSYHLPWMLGAPLVLIGLSVATSLKVLFGLSVLFSGLSMYYAAYMMFRNRLAATVASVAYIWAPFHFLTLYVSAAIGTAFSFSFVPLLVLGLWLSLNKKTKQGILLTSLSTAALILSHALTFIMVLPFVALFAMICLVFEHPSKVWLRRLVVLIVGGVIGLLLAGFYLTPFLTYSKQIIASLPGNGFTDIYKSNFANFSQLVYSRWGFGPIVSNAKDGEISLQVGIVQWLGVILIGLSLLVTRLLRRKKILSSTFTSTLTLNSALLVTFGASVFAMTDYSRPIWSFLSNYLTLDYPFRLLLVAEAFGSLSIGALVVAFVDRRARWLLAGALVVVAIYTNRNHVKVNMYTDIPLQDYLAAETTTNTFHEYLPLKADSALFREGIPALIEEPEQLIATQVSSTIHTTRFLVTMPNAGTITLSEFDFPGQQTYVDGRYVAHQMDSRGRIQIQLTAGDHEVVRTYEQTAAQQTGIIQTVLGLLILSKILLSQKKKT